MHAICIRMCIKRLKSFFGWDELCECNVKIYRSSDGRYIFVNGRGRVDMGNVWKIRQSGNILMLPLGCIDLYIAFLFCNGNRERERPSVYLSIVVFCRCVRYSRAELISQIKDLFYLWMDMPYFAFNSNITSIFIMI